MTPEELKPPRESATVVVLRQQAESFEVLMLKKHAALNYGGSWVFPGGIVEVQDQEHAQNQYGKSDRTHLALAAVVREAKEETGLTLPPHSLKPFANWLTPKLKKMKRYNTLFFICQLDDSAINDAITVDGEEIVAAQWLQAAQALSAHQQGEMILNGPSFVSLVQLSQFTTAQEAIQGLCADGISNYQPRGIKTEDGVATVYPGDGAYESAELNAHILATSPQPRHRLYMNQDLPWEYQDSRRDSRQDRRRDVRQDTL